MEPDSHMERLCERLSGLFQASGESDLLVPLIAALRIIEHEDAQEDGWFFATDTRINGLFDERGIVVAHSHWSRPLELLCDEWPNHAPLLERRRGVRTTTERGTRTQRNQYRLPLCEACRTRFGDPCMFPAWQHHIVVEYPAGHGIRNREELYGQTDAPERGVFKREDDDQQDTDHPIRRHEWDEVGASRTIVPSR